MKTEFKPFQKVLGRNSSSKEWRADCFRYFEDPVEFDYPYRCCGDCYKFCIPYEGNEELANTTEAPIDDWIPEIGEVVLASDSKEWWKVGCYSGMSKDPEYPYKIANACSNDGTLSSEYTRYTYVKPYRNRNNND